MPRKRRCCPPGLPVHVVQRGNNRQFFEHELPARVHTNIRAALNTGLVLGNDRFRVEVEQLSGQPQQLRKRGPTATIAAGSIGRD